MLSPYFSAREKSSMKRKTAKLELREQDLELFWMLLQQKFLSLELILKCFSPAELKLPSGKTGKMYHRLYRMVKAGFLRQHPYEGRKKVYVLTQLGLEMLSEKQQDQLSLVSPDDFSTMRHDLVCAELRHYLESFGGLHWNADREFRQKTIQLPQIPDGAIMFGEKDCFLEVELSQKSRVRYERIAHIYTTSKGPDHILYFFEDEAVVRFLKDQVKDHARFGFFPYQSPLPSPDTLFGWSQDKRISFADFVERLR